MHSDTITALAGYFGTAKMDVSFPILVTLLYGSVLSLGTALKDAAFGGFLCALVQSVNHIGIRVRNMNYYSKELYENEKVRMTAGVKARDDADAIMEMMGYCALPVFYDELVKKEVKNPISKFIKQIKIYQNLKTSYSQLKQGDTLLIQFPLKQTTFFYQLLINRLRSRGVRTIALIHDLQSLRHGKLKSTAIVRKIKMKVTETAILHGVTKIIVHNDCMAERMKQMGVDGAKLVSLGLFDYLIPNFDPALPEGKTGKKKPVIIAGNLRPKKVGYAYNLPPNCDFHLYGVDFAGRLHGASKYFGAFPPEEIPYVMDGSFGLVWDGRLAETCSDVFGDYLRINCPHKMSLYLASGLPVAIWKHAAQADFVIKNKAGITVESLYDLHSAIDKVTEEEYADMKKNAERIGERLRAGAFLKDAIARCGG